MLKGFTRIYPVEGNVAAIVPETPLVFPPAGETKYFAYHNCKTLKVGGTTMTSSTCGGRFCDRQVVAGSIPGTVVPCGCFNRKSRDKFVAEHNLRIPCDRSVSENRSTFVENFRSLQFDELLFQDGSQRVFETIDQRDPVGTMVLRSRVKRLVEHINGKHGWTVIGWVRTGRVKDANEEGNKEAMDIAAETVHPHVTYLYPTDPEDVDASKVVAYRALLITEDGFRKEVKAERQRLRQSREQDEGRARA